LRVRRQHLLDLAASQGTLVGAAYGKLNGRPSGFPFVVREAEPGGYRRTSQVGRRQAKIPRPFRSHMAERSHGGHARNRRRFLLNRECLPRLTLTDWSTPLFPRLSPIWLLNSSPSGLCPLEQLYPEQLVSAGGSCQFVWPR